MQMWYRAHNTFVLDLPFVDGARRHDTRYGLPRGHSPSLGSAERKRYTASEAHRVGADILTYKHARLAAVEGTLCPLPLFIQHPAPSACIASRMLTVERAGMFPCLQRCVVALCHCCAGNQEQCVFSLSHQVRNLIQAAARRHNIEAPSDNGATGSSTAKASATKKQTQTLKTTGKAKPNPSATRKAVKKPVAAPGQRRGRRRQ